MSLLAIPLILLIPLTLLIPAATPPGTLEATLRAIPRVTPAAIPRAAQDQVSAGQSMQGSAERLADDDECQNTASFIISLTACQPGKDLCCAYSDHRHQ